MSSSTDPYHLVIICGGAAGLFTAVNTARLQPNWKILVVEKTGKLLSKVKVSGGGRCNVTHACFDKREFPLYYPRGASLIKKYIHQFFTTDTIEWFQQRGVQLKKESDGRMFPNTDDSQTIIDVLLREASRYGVEFQLHATLVGLKKHQTKFEIQLSNGKNIDAFYCCLACGGLNKESSFEWLRQLGHSVIKPVPSLFTFNCPGHSLTGLMGVTVPVVKVKISGTKLEQTGPVLITHWGLSGPAVLRLSAWGARLLHEKEYRFSIQLNWLEGEGWNSASVLSYFEQQRQEHPSQQVTNSRMFHLPQRLWDYFLTESGITPQTRFAELKKKDENKLIKLLTDMTMDVSGKTTFKEEFVTAGGIDCAEIEATTMQSKLIPDLYFAGEIMDVDGITGGFNFQHAWSSGYLAALSIAAKKDQAS